MAEALPLRENRIVYWIVTALERVRPPPCCCGEVSPTRSSRALPALRQAHTTAANSRGTVGYSSPQGQTPGRLLPIVSEPATRAPDAWVQWREMARIAREAACGLCSRMRRLEQAASRASARSPPLPSASKPVGKCQAVLSCKTHPARCARFLARAFDARIETLHEGTTITANEEART